MSTAEPLVAWLHGVPVAVVTADTDDGGNVALRYTDDAFDRWNLNEPVLSCSLPLRSGKLDATAFVDGLLPEGDVRRSLAERRRIAAHDLFGFIGNYGRDIAGAVQFLEPDRRPDTRLGAVETLDTADLERLVAELDDNPLAIVEESELSLAGLQDKMLLVALDGGGWGRPLGGRPSTHILKRDHPRHQGIVHAEHDALALARHAGLTTISDHVERFGEHDCLVVERYDRVLERGQVVARIHQEDACQALGLPATRKYEIRHGGGGPEFSQIARLLDRHARDPLHELDRLAAVATFTALIGNADAHGKNLALLLADGHAELAPLYDTVPTVLWPALATDAAMTIGGLVSLSGISIGVIEAEARAWRHSPRRARGAAIRCAELLDDALDHDVIDPDSRLAAHVRDAVARFLATR